MNLFPLINNFQEHFQKQNGRSQTASPHRQEVVERLAALEQMGRVTGVFDDRGKFIFITEEEMDKVASFISKKGRCSIAELAVASNELVVLAEQKVPVAAVGGGGGGGAAGADGDE